MNNEVNTSALLVLGMHRSGTSALTGALRLCGVSLGDLSAMTEASPENHKGFWERKDIRHICDNLLHSAGADWWKIANLNLDAIPHAVLQEQTKAFRLIVSELAQSSIWAIKEPRLCLLLPILLSQIRNPVCIHVVRNPLEVAQSLRKRNGFPVAAGLALWETYNVHALRASRHTRRTFVSYNSLVSNPEDTLNTLVNNLFELSVSCIKAPSKDQVAAFIDSSLDRNRATHHETQAHLSPFQHALWNTLLTGRMSSPAHTDAPTQVTQQHLLDLESTEMSLLHQKNKLKAHRQSLEKRTAALHHRDTRIAALTDSAQKLNAALEHRTTSLNNLRTTLDHRTTSLNNLRTTLDHRTTSLNNLRTTLAQRDKILGQLEVQLQAESTKTKLHAQEVQKLKSRLTLQLDRVEDLDRQLSAIRHSFSWKLTAPVRALQTLFTGPKRPSPPIPTAQHPPPQDHSVPSTTAALQSPTQGCALTTYILPESWTRAHPRAVRHIARTGLPLIILGAGECPTGDNVTRIAGPHARVFALASVHTPTAIELSINAEPSQVAWEDWKAYAERREERQHGNAQLLTPASIFQELRLHHLHPTHS